MNKLGFGQEVDEDFLKNTIIKAKAATGCLGPVIAFLHAIGVRTIWRT